MTAFLLISSPSCLPCSTSRRVPVLFTQEFRSTAGTLICSSCFATGAKMSSSFFPVWAQSLMFQLLLQHSRPAQAALQRFQKWILSQLVILWNTRCPKPGSLLSSCQWFCAPPFSACCNSSFLNIKAKTSILLKSRIREEGSFPWRSTEGK